MASRIDEFLQRKFRVLLTTICALFCFCAGSPLVADQSTSSSEITVRGRVTVDGTESTPLTRLLIYAWDAKQEARWYAIDAGLEKNVFPQSSVASDGSFELVGIRAGINYVIQVGWIPRGLWLTSARLNTKDVLDSGMTLDGALPENALLTLTLSNRSATIDGRVTSPSAQPRIAFCFSRNRALWRPPWRSVKRTTVAADGTFSLVGLPGGGYWLVVRPSTTVTLTNLVTPAFFEALANADSSVAVDLREGESKAVEISGR